MKKLIMLTGTYYPKPFANGICVHKIAKVLMKKGYEIHVVCYQTKGESEEESFEGVKIHRVKPRFYYRLNDFFDRKGNSIFVKCFRQFAVLMNRLKNIIFFPLYPLTAPCATYRYHNKVRSIIADNGITNVLAVYCPIEAAASLYLLKKSNKSLKSILYVVDSFTSTPHATKHKSFHYTGWRWEKRLYRVTDLIINMDFYEEQFQNRRYDKYRVKMICLGLPLIQNKISNVNRCCLPKHNININCVFAGTLGKSVRNPRYLCEIFKRYRTAHIRLHFFSRGDCQNILAQYENETDHRIMNHPFLPDKEIEKILNKADVFINIGNSGTQMVPSKIFSYISYGKPIVHFYKEDNDSCLRYLKAYPLAFCIKEENDYIEEQAKELFYFVRKARHHSISFRRLKNIYIKNTPEYTADVIEDFLYQKEGVIDENHCVHPAILRNVSKLF